MATRRKPWSPRFPQQRRWYRARVELDGRRVTLRPMRGCEVVLIDDRGDVVARQEEQHWSFGANIGDDLLINGSSVDSIAIVEVHGVGTSGALYARLCAGEIASGDRVVRVLQIKQLAGTAR